MRENSWKSLNLEPLAVFLWILLKMGILKRTKTKAKNRERNNMRKDVDVEEAFLSQNSSWHQYHNIALHCDFRRDT